MIAGCLRDGFEGITGCNECDRTRRELTIARERSGREDGVVDIRIRKREMFLLGRVECAKY